MILNDPTIFGYDPKTGKFLGGGEAGSETVVGTGSLMDMIRQAVGGGQMAAAAPEVSISMTYHVNGGNLDEVKRAAEEGVYEAWKRVKSHYPTRF